ncbi:hypothetical protein F0562_005156 [Nyssa sinensis]|uniref:Pectinesterase inhibitor domain-containing protein n=1 Tax=Nyssa sinensis TaxID=561372 RepID=A0A5J5ALR6_9ASTE|nr:hypothetical protein F0562_005156 [Nyssa sinensis]
MGMVGKKTFFLAFLVMTVSATATSLSRAAVSSQRTKLKSWCKGAIDECLEEEVEYLMDSDINARLLQQGGKDPFTNFTTINIKTIGAYCDRGKYASCIPDENQKQNSSARSTSTVISCLGGIDSACTTAWAWHETAAQATQAYSRGPDFFSDPCRSHIYCG